MANDGNVKIGVKLDDKGFKEEVSGLGSFAQKGFSAIGSTTVAVAKLAAGAVTAATGAIATGLGVSVKVGAAFEAEMSKVSAISGATGDELSQLTEKAKEMGAATKFSASESAQAMEYMAMAGWKTTDMLSGIEGIMNLAAASGEDLATTSDIVTDALTAFGLSAADSTHFADVLAQASSNANTNVSLMGETFKYVAPVAGALGYSAEDTAVAIGLMANAGIKGSQAGTVLRSMMSRLAKPTKEVQGAMDRLGVSLTDNQGNMKSLDQIILDLRKGFSGLSEAESANVAASLAGQEAMAATEAGYLVDALAVKQGFTQLNTNIDEKSYYLRGFSSNQKIDFDFRTFGRNIARMRVADTTMFDLVPNNANSQTNNKITNMYVDYSGTPWKLCIDVYIDGRTYNKTININ